MVRRPTATGEPNHWNEIATTTGLITTATILASGISAAYIAIAVGIDRTAGVEHPRWLISLAASSAIISLASYGLTMLFGLATLNSKTEIHRATQAERATIALFIQAYAAIIFALVVITGSLLNANGG